MPLAPGTRIGPYEVDSALGAGGMGEVYRARDSRLHRDAALKVLPARFAEDAESMRRFEREARTLASLNHPNIAAIYGLEEANGVRALAMELVDGETLAARIARSPTAIEAALPIARQIAEALQYAHAKGMIHRDLKPANVMISRAGVVKLLDFGLAKLRPMAGEDDGTLAVSRQTVQGAILGTPSYMSPEQARGAAVDARSDIFSFGAVLYEMLSGRQAFRGDTTTAQLAAVLGEEPPPLAGIPAEVMRIVTRALAKKPDARYQRMEDVLADLHAVSQRLTAVPSRRRIVGLALAGAALLVLIGAGVRWGWTRRAPGRTFNSVAVLPLRNLSGGADEEWFSDGMTMTMITELSKVRTLKVISPASVMRYKKTQKSLKEIASELEVEALVEASAMREGGRVRISAQLSDAATARVLWANDYDRDMKDVLSLHRDIARAVASEVQASLNAGEQQRLRPATAVKPEAMEAYLKASYYFARIETAKAMEFAEEAVKLDPDFAAGYDLLANILILRADSGGARYAVVAPRARAAALRADALEPDRPGTLAALGWLALVVDRQWAQAEPLLRRASEQNAPNGSNYWVLPALRGKHQEAIDSALREARHDPMNPVVLINLGRAYDMARRFPEAIEVYQRIVPMNAAGTFYGNFHMTFSYLQLGRKDEAFQSWLETRKSRFKDTEDPARAQYQRGGWDAVWRLILQELSTRPAGNRMRMRAHVFLGEKARVLDELEAMEQNFDWWMFTLEDPILDPVRNESRFHALLKRLHYPDV